MMLLSPILALTLSSTMFKNEATVPLATVCRQAGGMNVSPQLAWNDVPAGTKSFALIVHDPDAPVPGGYYHWIVPNIPASTRHFARDTGYGYRGPCPPPGKVHHYHFTVYALDTVIQNASNTDGPALLKLIQGHVLAQATLTGVYEVKP